jgi:hypothetical protein
MKFRFLLTLLAVLSLRTLGAPAPFIVTDGPNLPQINALVWTNRGELWITNYNVYETQNTIRYVNLGQLSGYPGFRFETIDDSGFRRPAAEFVNRGVLLSEEVELTSNLTIGGAGDASHPLFGGHISIWATNIVNRAPILGAFSGNIQIRGENVDLQRSGIGNGPLQYSSFESFDVIGAAYGRPNTFPLRTTSFLVGPPVYFQEIGLEELWWQYGNMRVDYLGSFGDPFFAGLTEETPFGPAPVQAVITNPFDITTAFGAGRAALGGLFRVFCQTNQVNPTNKVVEIAFVQVPDTNVWVDVSWVNGPNAPDNPQKIAFIRLSTFGTNTVTATAETNSLVIVDSYAADPVTTLLNNVEFERLFQPTNIFMVRGHNMDVTTPIVGTGTNADFFPEIFTQWIDDANGAPFPGITMTNGVNPMATTNGYATWAGSVTSMPSRVPVSARSGEPFEIISGGNFLFGLGTRPLEKASLTNFAGRVAVDAKNLNLNRARLQARGALTIRTDNLVDSRNAALEAPILSLDLNSTNELVVQNLIRGSSAVLGGDFAVLSLSFSNFFTATNAATGGTPVDTDGDGVNDGCDTDGDGVADVAGDCPTDAGGGDTNFNAFYHVTVVSSTISGVQRQFVDRLVLRARESRLVDNAPIQKELQVLSDKFTVEGELIGYGKTNLTAEDMPNLKNLIVSGPTGAIKFTGLANIGIDRPEGIATITNSGTISASSLNVKAGEITSAGLMAGKGGQLTVQAGKLTSTADSKLEARFGLTLQGGDLQLAGEITSGKETSFGDIGLGIIAINAADRLVDGGAGVGVTLNTDVGITVATKPSESDLQASTLKVVVPAISEAEVIWAGEDLGPTEAGFVNNLALGTLSLDAGNLAVATLRGAGERNAIYCRRLEFSDAVVGTIEDTLNVESSMTIYFSSTGDNISAPVLDGFISMGGGKLVFVPSEADGGLSAKASLSEDGRAIRISWTARAGGSFEIQTRPTAGGVWSSKKVVTNGQGKSQLMQYEEALPEGSGVRLYRILAR